MLSKVVSHLKRRFRKKDPRHSQPPELNRWSDFMNPFPHVEPGGYTRYYQNHRLLADISLSLASTSRSLAESKQSPSYSPQRRLQKKVIPSAAVPPIRISGHPTVSVASEASLPLSFQGIDTSSSSSTTLSSPCHRPSKMALIAIPEESMASTATGKRRRSSIHGKNTSQNSGTSLRRRKRRMLRTPSMENDPFKPFSLSYSLSGASAVSHGSSASSHTRINSPAITTTTLTSDIGWVVCKTTAGEDLDDRSSDHDRPDSQLSFRTAKSDFGD